jgi:hypothetical protein
MTDAYGSLLPGRIFKAPRHWNGGDMDPQRERCRLGRN